MAEASRRPVAITGMGVVSPNGVGREAFADSCQKGRSGISPLRIDTAGLRSSVAGAVLEFDSNALFEPAEARRLPRTVPLALQASIEALIQAGVIDPVNAIKNARGVLPDRELARQIGVLLGTGGGGLAFVEEQYRTFFTEGTASLYSITGGTHGNLSSELSIALGLRGPSHVLSTGCTSSTDAIGYAMLQIRNGIVPMMLAGGADAPISRGILTGFEKMRVVSTRRWPSASQTSRPFSVDRDGFVLGEGSWMFLLEDPDHARARGATILAELVGYASTCDAYHRVQIAPDVAEPVRAMQLALDDAAISIHDIQYINLHGTATALNDRLETAAVRKCFGPRSDNIACSSTKSMIGHPQGACGAAGLAASVLGLRDGRFHPTINLERPDPDCNLDYIPNTARPLDAEFVLCNCIAFGSKNSALVLKRAD